MRALIIANFFIFFIFIHCIPSPKIDICDNYNFRLNQCENESSEISLKENINLRDFTNFLYFKKKITLGMKITPSNFTYLFYGDKLNHSCKYKINSKNLNFKQAEGELKGIRNYNNSLWCFDYLATMIQEFLENNELYKDSIFIKEYPALFPILVEIEYSMYHNSEIIIKKSFSRQFNLKN